MKITICGTGSLGHVCLGVLSNHTNVEVSLLSRRPALWSNRVVVSADDGRIFEGCPKCISSNPSEVIPGSDMVLLCLPGFLIEETLIQIRPYLSDDTKVGSVVSSTGFFFFAHKVLSQTTPLFGFQRAPFIARLSEYGKRAKLLGYKSSLSVACEHIRQDEEFRKTIEDLFMTPTRLLNSFYEAALTNSNPILHTGRLYSMWHNWDGAPVDRCSYFYKEWRTEDAQCLIDMDAEFMNVLETLPVSKGSIPTLLDYYEQKDAESLAQKLRSISAFQTIQSPMVQLPDGGWIPDFKSRYFTEDFPFGLRFIIDLARQNNVQTPTLDRVYEWGVKIVNNNL